jgi:hypothetical protein
MTLVKAGELLINLDWIVYARSLGPSEGPSLELHLGDGSLLQLSPGAATSALIAWLATHSEPVVVA